MRIALDEKISPHFCWREVLWLPKWGIHVHPNEEQADNLKTFFNEYVEPVRMFLGQTMMVTSALRPAAYNKLIGGSGSSWHILGWAVDFNAAGMDASEVRQKLEPRLVDLKIRMERQTKNIAPENDWVHIDRGVVGASGRYFIPY